MKQPARILAFCLFALTITLAHAEGENVYENPQNLKVLPKDISPEELQETMKGFSFALDIRCVTCHVGETGQPISKFDFAADEKRMKASARVMLKMVATINNKLLGKLDDDRREGVEVRCMTCHRGQDRPRLIQDILDNQYAEGGVDAAIAEYKRLRENYYGSHTYDFSDLPLNEYALGIMKRGDSTGALRLMDLSLDNNPDSLWGYWYKGRIQHASGDISGAITSFETAVERAPAQTGFLLQEIDTLKKKLEDAKN